MKNLKLVVLLVLLVSVLALSLTSCEELKGIVDQIPGIGHEHAFSEATCTTPKTCECGATEGEALGHTLVTDEAVAPTCTESGLTAGEHCSVCDEVITAQSEVPAKGHSYTSAVTAPTCTEVGYTTYTCACGDSYVADEVAATGHSHEAVVTAPTCEDEGYTTYTCHCGDTYTDNKVAALGHTFIDSKCVNCDAEYVPEPSGDWTLVTELKNGDYVLIGAPAYGKLLSATKTGFYNIGVDYSADNFANVTDAEIFVVTVNADGSYTFTSLTGEVIALADSYSSLNAEGVHKSWTLKANDETTFLLYNTGRDTYLEWYSSKNNWSTYYKGGTDEYYLSFYAKAPASGENHVHNHITSVVAPTCEEEGYTAYTCACGDTYKKDVVAATGHDYGEWTDVKPAEGESICEMIPMQIRTCACGKSETQISGEAPGHSYSEGTCSVCGKEDPDYVKPDTPVAPEGGEADLDAIVLPSSKPNGDSSYTGTYTSPNGWTSTNSAIQAGGATDMNPQFTVIGPDNTHKAVCLNGKTSAPGKLTSPTLTTGISKLTINYTKIFSDTELSVTVTITDAAGNKYTHVIAQTLPSTEKYVVYTDVWTLDTPIVGEFTIEIVNNCPSALDKNKDRFTILDIIWEGAAEAHTHEYTSTTTATCTAAGTTTYTCSCGDTYTEETEKLGHVDANLDVSCDRAGCTGKVAPAADSVLSNFTANNLGSKISVDRSYYVIGTIVEVLDAKSGIFLLDDGTGELFYIRLPKNADGVAHASWEIKLVLGDKIQVYGKVAKFSTSSAPNGQYWPSIQSGIVTILEQHPHDYTYTPATCFFPAYCACGQDNGVSLGHADGNADKICDSCGYSTSSLLEEVKTHFNNIKDTDKVDKTNGIATFDGAEFVVTITKGTASLNTNGSDHMRMNKGNEITIAAKNDNKIVSITFVAVSSSYLDELEAFLKTTDYKDTYTVNGFECTIQLDNLDSIKLVNGDKVQRIASVNVVYEKSAPATEA